MKIKQVYDDLSIKYKDKIKIFKKGIFWIILEEEAFFMAEYFNFKITSLDKNTIKIGFPCSNEKKWFKALEGNNIGYILVQKIDTIDYSVSKVMGGKYYNSIFKINLEDYLLTKSRILGLKKFNLEDKNEKNFLLQNKIEELYMIVSQLLIKLPKKERYYFRDKIEKIFLDTLELLYKYKYNLDDRFELINQIFSKVIILREFNRMLYNLSVINNDNVYLNISEKWIDILKICKGIKNKTN